MEKIEDYKYYKTVNNTTVTIPPIDEICQSIQVKFTDLLGKIDYYKDKYDRLKEGDSEYQSLIAQRDKAIQDLHRGFSISEKEEQRIKGWLKEHRKTHLRGNAVNYIFTLTPLGTVGKIKCSCGEEFFFKELD